MDEAVKIALENLEAAVAALKVALEPVPPVV